MISLEHVSKIYGRDHNAVTAVQDVSLEFEEGSFNVILGASGSGKSTLLNLVSALEIPSQGSITCGEVEVSRLSDRARTAFRRRMVGFVFQQYFLLPNLSVEANVRMGADLVKNTRYMEIIRAVGLENKAHQSCSTLSGGEQQRVSIARAVAKRPNILFLDEPTGALDADTGLEVLTYIERLHHEHGFTMLMVTHNPAIARMADRVIHMRSGCVMRIEENANPLHASQIGE